MTQPARPSRDNEHPEFVGLSGMIEKLEITKKQLESYLKNGEYAAARNQDFVIWCCPTNIPSRRYGYLYVVEDERYALFEEAGADYKEAIELILRSYGFDPQKGKFSIEVPPIDTREPLSSEFMYRLETGSPYSIPSHCIEEFIRGFIRSGYSYDYKPHGYLPSCREDSLQNQYETSLEERIEREGDALVYTVTKNEKLPLGEYLYDYELLKKSKWIEDFEYSEYHKESLIQDRYGNLWYHIYDENDHLYYIDESFYSVKDRETAKKYHDTRRDYAYPFFRANSSHGFFSFRLYRKEKGLWDKAAIRDEIGKIQRINGKIPHLTGVPTVPAPNNIPIKNKIHWLFSRLGKGRF